MRASGVLISILPAILLAQPPAARNPLIREGIELDLAGKGAAARAEFQKAIDSAATPAGKAEARRAMAMSWAFEGNCAKTTEYEDLVIDYWKTQNDFYEQGEMADEAARVCIDSGDLDAAERLYKLGHELGLKEPDIKPARRALWNYRWEHAQARLAARRGNQAQAERHVAAAKSILDTLKDEDARLFEQQSAFYPYLTGYVAFYSGDYKAALADFERANQNDAFIQYLTGMTYERLGDHARAAEAFRKAQTARGHNPPSAFAHRLARKKLAE